MSSENLVTEKVIENLKNKYGFNTSDIEIQPHITIDEESIIPDILVYKKQKSPHTPLLVVEIKKSLHPLLQEKLFRIMKLLNVSYGILTNGSNYLFYKLTSNEEFLEIPDIQLERGKVISSKHNILNEPINLSYKLQTVAWIIMEDSRQYGYYNNPVDAIITLQKILLCKLIDEKYSSKEQYLFSGTDPNLVYDRIMKLYYQVQKEYEIFTSDNNLTVSKEALFRIVLELQSYSLATNKINLAKSYYNVLYKILEKGHKFINYKIISKQMCHFIIGLLQPNKKEKMLNLYSGFGEFIVSWLKYFEKLELDEFHIKDLQQNIYGIEKNIRLTDQLKANLIIFGYENIEILPFNSVLYQIQNMEKSFDVIFNNPPISQSNYLSRNFDIQYPLIYKGKREEYLSFELALKLLKPSGRMAIIVPENFMFINELKSFRNFLIKEKLIKAIIRLPQNVFTPFFNIRTNILILEKNLQISSSTNYNIFVAEIPYDKEEQPIISSYLEKINNNYLNFLRGIKIDPVISPKIFLLNSSQLEQENWYSTFQTQDIWKNSIGISQVKLGEIVNIAYGTKFPSNEYKHSSQLLGKGENSKFPFLPYIRISDIINGRISNENIVVIDERKITDVDRYRLRPNNVLLSIRGTVGKVGLVTEEFNNVIASSQISFLKIKDENKIQPEYLFFVLQSEFVQEQIREKITGMTIKGISRIAMKEIIIPLPSYEKQINIIQKVKELEKEYERTFNYSHKNLSKNINNIIMGIGK